MSFIESQLKNAKKAEPNREEQALIDALLDRLENLTYPALYDQLEIKRCHRLGLAAIFDLIVAAKYYNVVENTNSVNHESCRAIA